MAGSKAKVTISILHASNTIQNIYTFIHNQLHIKLYFEHLLVDPVFSNFMDRTSKYPGENTNGLATRSASRTVEAISRLMGDWNSPQQHI